MMIPYSKTLIVGELLRTCVNSAGFLETLVKEFPDADDDYLLEVIDSFKRFTMINYFETRILNETVEIIKERIMGKV